MIGSTDIVQRGEVCIRTMEPFEGYYKDSQRTAAAVTHDGLYRTGDIGEIDSNGLLRIIGRRGNVAKMSNGKFANLDALELAFHGRCSSVAQLCLHADVS